MSVAIAVLPLDHARATDRRRFIRQAYAVYRGDPHFVAPLESEVHQVLAPENPFFEHARMQLWIAVRDGRDVGRIAAIEDRTHNALHGERTAFFGFFECTSDGDAETATALFAAAAAWARAQGLNLLRGPLNPSLNDECGLLVAGFDRPPVLMMTYNPERYARLLLAAGFVGVKDLFAYQIVVAEAPTERLRRLREACARRNPDLKLQPVTLKSLTADVPRIKKVYNEAWEKNWGAVPLTDGEIDLMVTRLKPLLVPGLAWLAMHGSEAVGFLLALPDFNTALQPLGGRLLSPGLLRALPYVLGWKRPPIMRLVALGVQREFRGQGIEAAMIAETLTACRREGFIECEASWVLEENTAVQRVIGLFGGKAYKTYRLYDRSV